MKTNTPLTVEIVTGKNKHESSQEYLLNKITPIKTLVDLLQDNKYGQLSLSQFNKISLLESYIDDLIKSLSVLSTDELTENSNFQRRLNFDI